MRRVIAVAAMTAAAFAGFGGTPASADVCALNILCAVSGCTGLVNVCPTASSCSGGVNVCPRATTCSGLFNLCDVFVAES